MRKVLFKLMFLLAWVTGFSQKQDSVLKATYQQAIHQLKQGQYAEALPGLSNLIVAGFPDKEIYVKRGAAYYYMAEFDKAKADLDEAVKARITTAELFEL